MDNPHADGFEPRTGFDQRGQRVSGPQYNADRIEFHQAVSPEVIAEGLRRYRNPPQDVFDSQWQAEAHDLKYYGFRHYSRDRNQWLQSLTPQERQREKQRHRDLIRYGGSSVRHHRRILSGGGLPSDTSPADPRYLRAKHALEQGDARRFRLYAAAAAAAMIALALIAIADGALWFMAILGLAAIFGVLLGVRKR